MGSEANFTRLGATVQLASGSPTLRGHCSAPRAIQGMKLGALEAAWDKKNVCAKGKNEKGTAGTRTRDPVYPKDGSYP